MISTYIDALKEIKKEELDERSFYEQVLSVIKRMRDIQLTPPNAEELKQALQEIGCVKFDVWKEEKEQAGEIVEDVNLDDGVENANIEIAVSMVQQLLGEYSSADFGLRMMLENNMIQDWLKNSEEKYPKREFSKVELDTSKLDIPYYIVAQEALMNWNGLSEDEAKKIILEQSFEEIDYNVDAKYSMDCAIVEILKSYGKRTGIEISEKDITELESLVYNGEKIEGSFADEISSKAEIFNVEIANPEVWREKPDFENLCDNVIMDTVFAVHDGWVKKFKKNFMDRDKKHQHMPSELIGWNEAKADLLFVKPIFEALGIDVNEDRLQELYNNRVKDFVLDNGITNSKELSNLISQGAKFYPALADYGEDLDKISDVEFVDNNIIPAIEENGIGKIEDIRKKVIDKNIEDPDFKEIEKLTLEEQQMIEQAMNQEVSSLNNKKNELEQKNAIIERLLYLSDERRALKRAIEQEELRRGDNINSLND